MNLLNILITGVLTCTVLSASGTTSQDTRTFNTYLSSLSDGWKLVSNSKELGEENLKELLSNDSIKHIWKYDTIVNEWSFTDKVRLDDDLFNQFGSIKAHEGFWIYKEI